jgi:hypothetical protein
LPSATLPKPKRLQLFSLKYSFAFKLNRADVRLYKKRLEKCDAVDRLRVLIRNAALWNNGRDCPEYLRKKQAGIGTKRGKLNGYFFGLQPDFCPTLLDVSKFTDARGRSNRKIT